MTDTLGERRLVAAMIQKAVEDMRSRGATRERLSAVSWLVTKDAQRWLDVLGLEQVWLLEHTHWLVHAHNLLHAAKANDWCDRSGKPFSSRQLSIVKQGIDYMSNRT